MTHRTQLYDIHKVADAKMVPFAGWKMPVQYPSGALAEHRSVREQVGLFDVSHMGNVLFKGERAAEVLDTLTTWPMSNLKQGTAKYTVMLNHDGGVVDDLIVYRLDTTAFLIIWNAGNHQKNIDWTRGITEDYGVQVIDVTEKKSLIALSGPGWQALYDKVFPHSPAPAKRFRFEQLSEQVLVARTGYTGEDGVEILVDNILAEDMWNQFVADGAAPCGLASRDSLRIEAGLPLYGHELSDAIDPYEGGVGFVVKLDDRDFIGREALLERKEQDDHRSLVGLKMVGRGVPREGYVIFNDQDVEIGQATSGTFSPVLNLGIGLALVSGVAPVGEKGYIEIRGKKLDIEFVTTPIHID